MNEASREAMKISKTLRSGQRAVWAMGVAWGLALMAVGADGGSNAAAQAPGAGPVLATNLLTTSPPTNSEAAGLINDYLQRVTEAETPGTQPGTKNVNATSPPAPGYITSSNLWTVRLQASNQVFRVREYQAQLEAARELRQKRDHRQAATMLIALLESPAPEELKRPALFELALVAQQEGQLGRAQQIYSQYVKHYHNDPAVPEVLLRQGILYRDMGVGSLALSKFYAVLSSALSLRLDQFEYYQRLVLLAQTEIAETYYVRGQFAEAAEFYQRLLRLESGELNKERMHFKYLKSLANLQQQETLVAQAKDYLQQHTGSSDEAEARFMLATALKQLGRSQEALQQVLTLLEKQRRVAARNPEHWAYWQQRTGNELANQLYQEGDYLNALEIYLSLLGLDPSPRWQAPVLYQIGLVHEHLKQPDRAVQYYQQVAALAGKTGETASPGLKALMEMAQWRIQFLHWRAQAENQMPVRPPAQPQLGRPAPAGPPPPNNS